MEIPSRVIDQQVKSFNTPEKIGGNQERKIVAEKYEQRDNLLGGQAGVN
jgi:hypothetical protein